MRNYGRNSYRDFYYKFHIGVSIMSESTAGFLQELASGKMALGVGIGTASSPTWISALHSETASAIILLLGALLTFAITCVNVQTFIHRFKDRAERKKPICTKEMCPKLISQ